MNWALFPSNVPWDCCCSSTQHKLSRYDWHMHMACMYMCIIYYTQISGHLSQKKGFFTDWCGIVMWAEGRCGNGSPLSAMVTNLYMEFFKDLIAPSRPRLWKRYVDDIFCILRRGTAELLNHLKGFGLYTIKLTVEWKMGPFLSWTIWPGGGRVEVWTSLSTENPHTQTGLPPLPIPCTTQPMWREVWSSVSMTEPKGSSAHRTNFRRKWTCCANYS